MPHTARQCGPLRTLTRIATKHEFRLTLTVVLGIAGLGLAITAVIVAYIVLTDSSPPQSPNISLTAVFVILCPPSLLSGGFIDADPGTGGFYVIWTFIGLFNSLFYAAIAATVMRLRAKSDRSRRKSTLHS
jgi:hypothetical protein